MTSAEPAPTAVEQSVLDDLRARLHAYISIDAAEVSGVMDA